jgi:hypothetical protein
VRILKHSDDGGSLGSERFASPPVPWRRDTGGSFLGADFGELSRAAKTPTPATQLSQQEPAAQAFVARRHEDHAARHKKTAGALSGGLGCKPALA